jgi:hypothetical protein
MHRIALILAILAPLFAQEEKQQKQEKQPKREAAAPTNLKVLKGASGAEVGQIMRTFTAGLGVQCAYCHIQGNFASDENPKKETARHMIEMTKLVNTQFPDKKMHVTCYTCHRGEAEPKTAPEPRPGG